MVFDRRDALGWGCWLGALRAFCCSLLSRCLFAVAFAPYCERFGVGARPFVHLSNRDSGSARGRSRSARRVRRLRWEGSYTPSTRKHTIITRPPDGGSTPCLKGAHGARDVVERCREPRDDRVLVGRRGRREDDDAGAGRVTPQGPPRCQPRRGDQVTATNPLPPLRRLGGRREHGDDPPDLPRRRS